MTAFILLLTAISLELANSNDEIKPDTNNVQLKAIFIPFALINALHNLHLLLTIYQFMKLFNTDSLNSRIAYKKTKNP